MNRTGKLILAAALLGMFAAGEMHGRYAAKLRDAVLIASDGQGHVVVDVYDRHGELETTARLPEVLPLSAALPGKDGAK